jgi:hypothetical protein
MSLEKSPRPSMETRDEPELSGQAATASVVRDSALQPPGLVAVLDSS